MAFDPTIAGITLAGSLLSAIASFCVLACFVFFNKSQRSFRHALVFNLALAGMHILTTLEGRDSFNMTETF